ncbi:MAG TPA: DNA-formamidopyrimidine glycosylase family protein [Candidatus Limnocylindrales bacterium]|nr:DNA-formamidopyrimidine glycosylase family protein [Candidatus Limnocylindrales bacterium]
MPEGHTIHRLATRHLELFGGTKVTVDSPQGRFTSDAGLLTGRALESTEACGKHLLHHYAGGLSLHIHLGLYGKFADGRMPLPPPVGQIRLRLRNRRSWLELRGPSACELVDEGQTDALKARLGADPLRADALPDEAFARIGKSDKPLAALLLDQSIIAGAGLIFVIETLYRAGLRPTVPGRSVSKEAWLGIWADLCDLMALAVKTGRIDTVRDKHLPEAMGRPPRVDQHGGEVYVYRRAGMACHACGGLISRGELAGRNTYWCPSCQPPG